MEVLRDIETYAQLRGAIEAGRPRGRVLAEADLTLRQWMAVQRHWLHALTAEARRGHRRLAEKYQRAFDAAAPVAEPAPNPAPAPTTSPPAARAPTPASPTPMSPVVPAVPASPVIAPLSATSKPTIATAAISPITPSPSIPFAGQTAAPTSAAAEAAAEAQAMIGATADAMPALSDEELGPAFMQQEDDLDGTGMVNLEDLGSMDDAIPFSGAAAAPPRSAAPESGDAMGGTAFVGALTDDDLGDALPFAESHAAEPVSLATADLQDQAGGTGFVGHINPEDVLPFAESNDSPAAPALTLEQWASLVVELYRDPSARAATLHRYHLTEATYASEEKRFQAWFIEDPGQYGRYRALYDQYSNWLLQQ